MSLEESELLIRNAKLTGYRWLLLIVSCIVILCIGSLYTWSVFSLPMAKELGVDSLTTPFSTATSLGVFAMIAGGLLNDKYGPRWVVFCGGLMFGFGMFLSGMANSVSMLIVTYGLLTGLGAHLIYTCAINNTIKFFPDKRGLIGGVTTACYGVSAVIMSPVANAMNDAMGVRSSFKVLGVIFLVLIVLSSFIMKKCPSDFIPKGYTPPAGVAAAEGLSPIQMVKTPVFYIMLVLLACGAYFGMMIISSAQGLAVNMVASPVATASLLVSVLSLFNMVGRLVAGILSDKFGRINVLTVALVIAAAGLGALLISSFSASMPVYAVGLILIGISFGTFLGVYPGFCADQFGTKYNSVNYGILWLGYAIAAIAGPSTLSGVFDATGHYSLAFIISFGVAILGLILTFVYRAMARKK